MPMYTGQIGEGKMNCTRPDLLDKWKKRNDGLWWKADFGIVGKHKDPKTAAQLGYYWGLLQPEIWEQLVRDGHTITVEAFGKQIEIPFTAESTHEMLTALCGHVGDGGKAIRLSDDDMDIAACIKFIDGVLNVAADLGMNMDELRSRRPE